jgi:hypothetical protein
MAKQPKTISRTEPPATPVEPAGTTTAASVLEEPSSEPVKTAPSAEAGDPKAVVESFNKEPIVPVPPAKKHPLDLNPLATPKHVFSWERAEQKETKP